MHLAHNPDALAALRPPSKAEPWRVLVSGCIMGLPVAVDGSDYGLGAQRPVWLASPLVRVVPFCPEDTGIGTPRTMPDLHGGDGFDVLDGAARVLDEHGTDLTEQMLVGARAMRDTALQHAVDFAVLTDRSGACGSQVVSIGCRFEEPVHYRLGMGVAAAMLVRAGVRIVSHRDHATLAALHQRIDPAYVPPSGLRDHHQHPWVLDNLV